MITKWGKTEVNYSYSEGAKVHSLARCYKASAILNSLTMKGLFRVGPFPGMFMFSKPLFLPCLHSALPG